MTDEKIAIVYDYDEERKGRDIVPLLQEMGYKPVHFSGAEPARAITSFIEANHQNVKLLLTASQRDETGPTGYQLAHYARTANVPTVMYTYNTGFGGNQEELKDWNADAGFYQYDDAIVPAALKAVISETIAKTATLVQKTTAIDPEVVRATRDQPRSLGQ